MPQKGSSVFGHLYVKLEIDFPKTGDFSSQILDKIGQLLPENKEDNEDKEEQKDKEQKDKEKSNKNNKKAKKKKKKRYRR